YPLASCLAVQRDDEDGDTRSRFQAVFPDDVLRLRAESESKAQDWVEALRTAWENNQASSEVLIRSKPGRERRHREAQRAKRHILTCLAVEKGLTAQSFRCAGDHLFQHFLNCNSFLDFVPHR
ncbi:hypothetical protein M9458_020087, partial [Cirrhinus mrigala]